MADLLTAHTSALDPRTLEAARSLLLDVFESDFQDHDWEHALGGIHALVVENGEVIGHAAVVQRRLLLAGRALRTGYVEGVAVRADRRRRGHGAAMMEALEHVICSAYDIGALAASDAGKPFYAARGWTLWRGPLSALKPSGVERSKPGSLAVHVFDRKASLNPESELTCDWRDGELW
jgi:aminoglycoside 2'-N-acetyltransferase I